MVFPFLSHPQSTTWAWPFLRICHGQSTSTRYAWRPSVKLDLFVDTAILPVQFANLNFMSLVLPTLDYCSSLWDPAYMVHISKLEAVQKLAAKIVTKKWNCDYESLLSNLHRPRLSLRRTKQKMALCFRILKGYSIIPPIFTPHPTPHLRQSFSPALLSSVQLSFSLILLCCQLCASLELLAKWRWSSVLSIIREKTKTSPITLTQPVTSLSWFLFWSCLYMCYVYTLFPYLCHALYSAWVTFILVIFD